MALRGARAGSIRVEGLSRLIRDFQAMDKEMAADMRRELINIGNIVTDEAKDNRVPAQDLAAGQRGQDDRRNTGKLQRGLRARMRGTATIVENRAKRDGYLYPSIYEYGKGRPFLEPALDAKTDEIMEALEDMIDRLTSANGFGRGGLL